MTGAFRPHNLGNAFANIGGALLTVWSLSPPPCVAARPDSLLHAAVLKGDLAEVRRLVESGTPVDTRGKSERTPLHMAATLARTEIAKFLIASGADPGARDDIDCVPLQWAVYCEAGPETVAVLLAGRSPVNLVSETMSTPLSVAAARGDAKVVAVLVKFGADVNQRDTRGRTPLWYALHDSERKAMVAQLRELGATDAGADPP